MSPSALYALGLGEISSFALNQPFDASRAVSAARRLGALRASLASNDTFVRYGLDARLSLGITSGVRSDGRDVLKVTPPAVTEPS